MTYDEIRAAYLAAGGNMPDLGAIDRNEMSIQQIMQLSQGRQVMLPDGRMATMLPDGSVVAATRIGDTETQAVSRWSPGAQAGVDTVEEYDPNQWRDSLLGATAILTAPVWMGMAGNYLAGAGAGSAAGGGTAAGGAATAPAAASPWVASSTGLPVLASELAPAAATAGGLSALSSWATPAAIAASTVAGAAAANRAGQTQADAARDAGQAQLDAARYAADSTLQATRESNDLLREQFDTIRQDAAPWQEAGRMALRDLTAGLAPDGQFATNLEDRPDIRALTDRIGGVMDERFVFERDPGYEFRLSEGEKALNRAALAGGRYDSGRALKDLLRYGQDYASNEYDRSFDRFRTDRADRLNMFGGERTSRFNMGSADRTDRFNRLSSLAGTGQTTNQQLANAGMDSAARIGSNTIAGATNAGQARMAGSQAYGNAATGAAAARASGYVGATNAITSGVGAGLNYGQSNRLLELLTRNRGDSNPFG